MDVDGLWLSANNCEEMSDVVVQKRRGEYGVGLPIGNAKVTHFVPVCVCRVGLIKHSLVIVEYFKVHNCSNTTLNKPCSAVLFRLGPAPQDIGCYDTKMLYWRVEVARTSNRNILYR